MALSQAGEQIAANVRAVGGQGVQADAVLVICHAVEAADPHLVGTVADAIEYCDGKDLNAYMKIVYKKCVEEEHDPLYVAACFLRQNLGELEVEVGEETKQDRKANREKRERREREKREKRKLELPGSRGGRHKKEKRKERPAKSKAKKAPKQRHQMKPKKKAKKK